MVIKRKWRDSIAVSEKILTITEIWPSEESTLTQKLKILFFFVMCLIFDLTLLDELKNLLLRQDYETLAMHLSTFGLYIGYTIKIIIFQFRKKAPMQSLLQSIKLFDEYFMEMELYKTKCIKTSNGLALFYVCCVAASIGLYLNKPFFTKYNLPVTFSHELNTYTFYGLLVLQSFCNYYLVMIGIAFDMIIIGLINIATAQLDILRESILNFKPKNPTNLQEEEHEFFSKCASRHEAVVKFISEAEDVFTFIFLTQSLASVTSICNGMFQLAHTGKMFSVEFYFNCAFTFDVLFELGICCWFGTLLTIKSVEVGDACYHYDWLNSPSHTRKLLLMIILRSQRPMYITAGKIIRLSMGSYLSVLKTAYSYFALMQSLYDKVKQPE
ncbi:putative odorant receptor 92a isoform X2 [Euwallacea fornicatus]|uniref:putative odorant receptor 92a isoform X2 n=1 Tax=Euwallacea fornicatus TaxID=995702 RepID=UPI00338D85CF